MERVEAGLLTAGYQAERNQRLCLQELPRFREAAMGYFLEAVPRDPPRAASASIEGLLRGEWGGGHSPLTPLPHLLYFHRGIAGPRLRPPSYSKD